MDTTISPLDIATLRYQLDKLTADTKMLSDSIVERSNVIKKLENEIEQYRGAAAYNAKLVQDLDAQITALTPAKIS